MRIMMVLSNKFQLLLSALALSRPNTGGNYPHQQIGKWASGDKNDNDSGQFSVWSKKVPQKL